MSTGCNLIFFNYVFTWEGLTRIVLKNLQNKRKLSLSSVLEAALYPVIELSPSLSIPTYYLVISATLCLSLLWVVRRAFSSHLSRELTLDVSLILMISGFVGARLFHVFYESPEYYAENWLRIFEFWNGGFVFYGGALLAAPLSILFLHRKTKGFFESYLDLFAPVISFTYILGRGACFLAGCCYGRYCELPWAVAGRHPTQLYAMLWELGVLFILLGCEKIPAQKRRPAFLAKSGSILYLWMILHALGRLIMEAFRDDFRGPVWGLSISSWISVAVLFAGFLLIRRKPTQGSSAGGT